VVVATELMVSPLTDHETTTASENPEKRVRGL
jgi:hypothetical protein